MFLRDFRMLNLFNNYIYNVWGKKQVTRRKSNQRTKNQLIGNLGIGTSTPIETLSVSGNFSTTKTNVSIGNGNFTVGQFNSSCTGFRFGTTGGWILSCAP